MNSCGECSKAEFNGVCCGFCTVYKGRPITVKSGACELFELNEKVKTIPEKEVKHKKAVE